MATALSRDLLSRHLRIDVVLRMLADAVLVSLSFLVSIYATRVLPAQPGTSPSSQAASPGTLPPMSSDLAEVLFGGLALVATITLVLFVASGIYVRARFYRAEYKVPILIQSITLAYLLVAIASRTLGFRLAIPWSTIGIAWAVTLLLVIGTRFLSNARAVLSLPEPGESAGARVLRKVLVIGGAGYIGSMLCRQLLERDYQVRVLDALLYGDDSLRDLVSLLNFELIEGDSRDIASLVRAVRGVDAIVHLGEIVGDPACALDEQVTVEINLAATRLAAEVGKGLGVQRFVYASSCSVYGAADGIVDERSGLNPLSLYARVKIRAERVLLELRDRNFHPVIVRFATVYGLSHRPRFDLVVNTLAARAYCDGAISIYGGEQWRPFVHVADVARALILCLEKPLQIVDGEIFNVGSDSQNYTIRSIGDLIVSELPATRVQVVETANDERDYRVSFSKIRDQLQFQPRRTVRDGICEIVAAFSDGRLSAHNEPRYHNAASLITDPGSHKVHAVHPSPLYQPDRTALDRLLASVPVSRKPEDQADTTPASAGVGR